MPSKITIATGASRFEVSWKNVETTWEKFLKRLDKPVVTKETYEQYMKLPKEKQDAIKDVGGFVGGVINGGRRVKNSCSARYLITLDVDYAPPDFHTEVSLAYPNEYIIYGTHKHREDNPRYRLIMPLEREVHTDEYEAIARRIAGNLGIELFDPTTFQPERLMYWPSISSDVDYYIKRQEGPWLSPDDILAEYTDWRDVSSWPISEKATKKLTDAVGKQEDPADKAGIVGVFCRVYGIKEAVEKFLPDVYEEGNSEDRLTYSAGTTSNGVIVYDNEFTFSHHASDPTSGRLCNSFDLVRIHLFGESDDRVEEGTPHVKRPSYGKMIELALGDDEVKALLVKEKRDDRGELMEQIFGKVVESDIKDDWAKDLEVDKRGNIQQTIANLVLILERDEGLRGALSYDKLLNMPVLKKDLPWRKCGRNDNMLTDADGAELRNYLEMLYGITKKDKIEDAVEIVTRKNAYHPVVEYLKSLKWDGRPRLDRLLVEYLGAEDSDYVRSVTAKTLVAAVARVFEPGVKFDTALVLVGAQGIGKSTIVARLGGDWFSDTFGNLQSKEAMENLQGVWIMEIGELAGLKKHEVDTIKLFISKQHDWFRVAYGRRTSKFPRQCVFIGTTNNDEFLQDQTGNRRFWPVRCGATKVRKIEQDEIDQVWAEACVRYVQGENLYLEGETEARAREIQAEHTEKDEREDSVRRYIDMKIPADWYEKNIWERREWILSEGKQDAVEGLDADKDVMLMVREWVTVPEIWTELFKGEIKDMTKFNIKYIRDIMNKIQGWEPKLLNKKEWGHQRGWVRSERVRVEDPLLG